MRFLPFIFAAIPCLIGGIAVLILLYLFIGSIGKLI